MGALTSVADIWLELMSVEIDCGAKAESYGGRKRLFSWDQCLLEIFGQGPCQFGIFCSGMKSVEGVDAPDQGQREDMLCGYVGSR